jgi:hypothetical protein
MEESNQLTDQQPRHSDTPSAELGFALPPPARLSRGRALTLGVIVLGALGGLFLFAFAPRRAARADLERQAADAGTAPARLAVAPPKLVSSDRSLRLPASIQPLEEAVIYARANGYVGRWLVDLGDKVKADQLLAEIETPEVNQELSQGRATLAKAQAGKAQAEASRSLAKPRPTAPLSCWKPASALNKSWIRRRPMRPSPTRTSTWRKPRSKPSKRTFAV